jgi:hypothetical protein
MEPLKFLQEELGRNYEDHEQILRQLPKLPQPIARVVIDELLETCVIAQMRNPSSAKAARNMPTGARKAPAPKPPGDHLNTAQAAVLAGKTPATIRRWARMNLIPLTVLPDREGKPARIYTIPKEAFKRWLKDHNINVPPD